MSQATPKPVAVRLSIRKAANGYIVDDYDPITRNGEPTMHVFESFAAASAYLASRFGEVEPEPFFRAPEGAAELARGV